MDDYMEGADSEAEPAEESDPPALTSYKAGFDQGYAQGEADRKQLDTFRLSEAEGVPPRKLRFWQGATFLAIGLLIGFVAGIVYAGR
jgi:hypothetical protein